MELQERQRLERLFPVSLVRGAAFEIRWVGWIAIPAFVID